MQLCLAESAKICGCFVLSVFNAVFTRALLIATERDRHRISESIDAFAQAVGRSQL